MSERFYTAEVTINNALGQESVIPFPKDGEIRGITSSEDFIHIGITYSSESNPKNTGLVLSDYRVMKVVKDGESFSCQNVIFDQIIYTEKYGSIYVIIEKD